MPLDRLKRRDVRAFLDWVYDQAVFDEGTNRGRTANKARENLRAVMSWAWEHELIETLPRFPKLKAQRDVTGRHYLTKAKINALYFAIYNMKRPTGWGHPLPIAKYWQSGVSPGRCR